MLEKIGPITGTLIDSFIKQLKKKETREKITQNVIDPVLYDITSKYYPYFIITSSLLILIIVLLIIILIILLVNKKKE